MPLLIIDDFGVRKLPRTASEDLLGEGTGGLAGRDRCPLRAPESAIMGLVLDSGVLIAAEREAKPVSGPLTARIASRPLVRVA